MLQILSINRFWLMSKRLVSILKYRALDLLDGTVIIFSDLCLWIFNLDFLVYFGWVTSVQIVFALPWRWRVSTGSFSNIFKLNFFLWSFLRNWLRILPGLLVVGGKNALGLSLSIIMIQIGGQGPINWRRYLLSFLRDHHIVIITVYRRPVSDWCIKRGLYADVFFKWWVALFLDPWWSQWTSYRLSMQSSRCGIQLFKIIFVFLLDF